MIGMICSRCDGLRTVITIQDSMSGESLSGWQCLLCGDVIDSVIAANRKSRLEPTRSRARLPGSVPMGAGKPKSRGRRL